MSSPKKTVQLPDELEASPRGQDSSSNWLATSNSVGQISRLVRDVSPEVVSMWRDPTYRGEPVTDAPSTSAPNGHQQRVRQRRTKQLRAQQEQGTPRRQGPSNFTRLPEIPQKPRSLPASPASPSRPPRHHRPGSQTHVGRCSLTGGSGLPPFIAGATVAGPLTTSSLKPAVSNTAVAAAALFAVSAGQTITAASIAYTAGNGSILPTTNVSVTAGGAAAAGVAGGAATGGSGGAGGGTPEQPSTAAAAPPPAAGGGGGGGLAAQPSGGVRHVSATGDGLVVAAAADDDAGGGAAGGDGAAGGGAGGLSCALVPAERPWTEDERMRSRLVSLPNIVCRSANGDVFLVDLGNVQAMLHKRELGEEGLAILNRLTPSLAHSIGAGGGGGGGAAAAAGSTGAGSGDGSASPTTDRRSRRRRSGRSRRSVSILAPDADDGAAAAAAAAGSGSGASPTTPRAMSSRSINRVGSMAPRRGGAVGSAAAAAALQRGGVGSTSAVERDPLMEAELVRHLAATDEVVEQRRHQLQEDWRRSRTTAANPVAAAKEYEEARRAAAIEFAVHRFVPRRLALMALNMPLDDSAATAAAPAAGGSGAGAMAGDGSGAGPHSGMASGDVGVFGSDFKHAGNVQHWKQLQAGMERLYDKMPFMANWVSTIKKLHREENGGWNGLIHGVDELYVKGREEHQGTNIYVLKCNELGVTPSTQVIQQLSSPEANMSHCHLGRQGAAALRHALSANVTITHLNLHDNHLDATGLESILAGLYSGTMAKQPRARRLLEKRIQTAANTLASAVHSLTSVGTSAAISAATSVAVPAAAASPGGVGGASGPPSPTASPAGGGGAAAVAARLAAPLLSPPRRGVPGDLTIRLIPVNLAKEQEQRRLAEEERQRQEEAAARAAAEAGALMDGPEWLRLINDQHRPSGEVGGRGLSYNLGKGHTTHVHLPARKSTAGGVGQPQTPNRLTCAITSLDLSNNPLGINGVRALADLLDPTVTPYQFVKQLLLNKCGIPEGGGRALALALSRGNTRLAVLGLSNNSLGNATAAMFGEVLALPSGLEDLDLSWNQIKSDGARALAEGVAQNNTLTRLNLSWNGLENPGVEALGAMLLRNESLTSLDLTNTRMGAEACLMLAEGIRNNHTLEALILNGNSVGDDGARFLMDAIKINNSLRYLGLQGTNMSTAARGNSQAASFNPLSPDGSYELNMETPTDRAVALQLAALDAAAPSELMKNIRLGDKNIASCKAVHWPDCLPVSGILTFDFVTRRVSKVIGVLETKKFMALAAQCSSSAMSDKEKLALVEVMAPFNYVLCHQAATLLRTFSIGDEMVLAAALLFTRCADLDENVGELTEALGADASAESLQRALGWYSFLRFSNPTGHYELALSSRVHAALASRLKDVAYSEPVEALNWHNVIHDQYTKVSKVAPNFGPPEEWGGLVPHAGTLSFDYVSGCLVPDSAQPVSDTLLDEVITKDLGISLDPSGRPQPATSFEAASQQVARLRPLVSHMAFTTGQVKKLMEAFAAPPHRVEVLVTCYCLVVDRSNMYSVLYGMEPLEQALAMWRLGPSNLFDKTHPTGHYVLDLTNPHHETVARKLVDLAMASPDLPNFWNLRVNGVKRSVIENRNMWGAFMAETQTPLMEFDFIGSDGWELLGRTKVEAEALGPGDRLDLRSRQAKRMELSRLKTMYAYYEDGSGWTRPSWQSRYLLMRALADKAPWQAAWDRMARLLLRCELRRGGVDGESPLEDLFYGATAGEDAMTSDQWEALTREWGFNRLEAAWMYDLFETQARPAIPKDGPAYKPYPAKMPTSPGGGGTDGGSPPPAAAAPGGALSSPVAGRSLAQRDRTGSRQPSQLNSGTALAATAFGGASSPPGGGNSSYGLSASGADVPSPPRGRTGALSALVDLTRGGSQQQAAQQPLQTQLVPNLVVEFPGFVRVFMREPPRQLRLMHASSSAVVDGVEITSRPSRRGTRAR